MVDQRIAVTASVALATALTVAHLAATGLVWVLPLPISVKAALTLAIAISFMYYLARDALLHAPHSIVAMEVRDGVVSLQTRGGDWLEGELLESSYVSDWLTIVKFRPRGRLRGRRLILVPDNVHPADFRRLRTWMRWRGDGGPPEAVSDLAVSPAGTPKNLTK